ncbi:MAG: NADH-quinone oxidoreductase subunit H [Dehalococcoidia bacterium]|nr:MAG: NADH-quinone oxidoreductase subunit H [Dehalococcoidia bacterium]
MDFVAFYYQYIWNLSSMWGSVLAWLQSQTGLPGWAIYLVFGFGGALGAFLWVAISNIILVFGERRLLGRFQIRFGPNRVGPNGTLQLIADALKSVGKELVIPAGADKPIYVLGPIVAFIPAMMGFAVFTFGPTMSPVTMDIGVLYFQAVTSLTAFAAFMAGWSSNNKFALFGAMRAVAQFVSYEIPLVLAVISVVLVAGTMNTLTIANQQTIVYALVLPIALFVFTIASIAEANRTPMDIVEAESEIVAGYHTEYGGMAFIMFYAAEYTHALAFGAMLNVLFLGGWKLFWLDQVLPPWLLFILKSYFVFFILIWMRATFPRLRIDQLMSLGWKVLVPLALVSLVLTSAGMLVPGLPLLAVAIFQWVAAGLIILAVLSRLPRRTNREEDMRARRLAAQAAMTARTAVSAQS